MTCRTRRGDEKRRGGTERDGDAGLGGGEVTFEPRRKSPVRRKSKSQSGFS